MPIRFTCLGCGKRLSTRSHTAGQQVKCPICKRIQLVPSKDAPTGVQQTPPPPPTAAAANVSHTSSNDSPPRDVPDELIYALHEDRPPGTSEHPNADQTITVRRHIIYLQGILLGVVALVFFVFGIIVGTHSSDHGNVPVTGRPCTVSGQVTFQNAQGHGAADSNCTACLVPATAYPKTKLAAAAFRPSDASLLQDRSTAELIRQLGGDFMRTDSDGRYHLRVPSPGRYYLLVISYHASRPADQPPSPRDLAQIGRYFLPVTGLLNDHKYRWQILQLRSAERMNIVF